MSSDECLITKMLNELEITHSSIKTQTAAITDVLDKSNNVLLQIEASRSLKPATNNSFTPYTYKKETVNVLIKIVEKFMNLLSGDNNLSTESSNFEDYLEAASQKCEYLGCNVRKLLAIWDTVQQMRLNLERQELETNSDDDIEGDDEF